jgi:hypothetical protein
MICASGTPAARQVRFRPSCLARYKAESAAASRVVSSAAPVPRRSRATTPIETVTRTHGTTGAPTVSLGSSPLAESPPIGSSSPIGTDSAAMAARSRSAMASAWSSRVCGSRIANSSPPNRPARS